MPGGEAPRPVSPASGRSVDRQFSQAHGPGEVLTGVAQGWLAGSAERSQCLPPLGEVPSLRGGGGRQALQKERFAGSAVENSAKRSQCPPTISHRTDLKSFFPRPARFAAAADPGFVSAPEDRPSLRAFVFVTFCVQKVRKINRDKNAGL